MKLIFTCTLLLTLPVYGQFSKYKARTKFNKKDSPTSAAPQVKIPDVPTINAGGNTDTFGRSTSQGNSVIKKDKNYVNLNPETAFGPEVITSFNFPDTSLTDLTKQMQKLTGINLILDKDIKGKVSILAPSPITVGDAWKAYLTALEMNGLTLVQSGSFWKVVSTRDIRYTPTKIYTGNYTPNTDNYVMRIIPLKNIDSSDVMRSFRPFMSRYGRILDIKQTNTLIVQDTGSNINRLVRLVKFIDVPGHDETLQIIPVKHSSAQEIANLLDEILKGNSRSSRRTKGKFTGSTGSQDISRIIAEPRTNTIIAMANAQGAKRLRELILKLDVKDISRNGGRIHVYYLNHGDSETLAKTLSSLVSGAQANSSRRSSRRTLSRRSSSSSPVNGLFSAEVKITADKENNALVVTASPTDYLTLKEVIAKLDIPRDQVYVEGLMMETQVKKNRGFGVSVMGVYGSGNARKVGFTKGGEDGLVSLLTNQITSLGGLFAGIGIGKTVNVEVGGQTIAVNTINGLIQAIATNSNTNVLATPQILALDNTEAVFEVGSSIPTPETQTAASGTTTTSIKQQKVGMTLKITPQINKVTRFIKLKIEQKMQDFSEQALPSGLASQGVATIERNINNTVTVRDRDTIAMGGLMRDQETQTESKVPLLGDIPVLGWLFKNRQKTVEKVNLLFFLTPRILANYQKDNANQIQDLLNRRSGHLKNVIGEDDPFGTTAKGLYEKAKKQEDGPLYDDTRTQFRDTNEGKGIQGGSEEDDGLSNDRNKVDLTQTLEPPNYLDIVQKVKAKQAAPNRESKKE
jgi:general secretion pathway protein D